MSDSTAPAVSLTVASNSFGDRFLAEINQETFARQEAASVFARQFADSFAREQTLYIVIGSDSGLLIDYIQQSPLPRGSRYLFVEPEAIKQTLAEVLRPLQNERVRVCGPDDWFGTAQDLGLDTYCYTGNIQLLRSLGADGGPYSEYRRTFKRVEQELAQQRWKLEIDTGLHLFIKNNLANLADNHIPASILIDAFKGKTALIMAAGPSLDGVLPWIKQNRDEVVLIAVSRIARLLLDNNIPPDIIVSVDPQEISFSISKEIFKLGEQALLAHSCCAIPSLVGQWPYKKVYTGPQYFWERENSPNVPLHGPTVTNDAISIAVSLGCAQILLAGVDLCYSQDGYSHASGTIEHSLGPLIGEIDHTVETNSGKRAETNKGYYECIIQISEQAKEAQELGSQLINLSADAARIPGVSHSSPDELDISSELEQPAHKTIQQRLQKKNTPPPAEHYKAVVHKLTCITQDVKTVSALATDAIKFNHKLNELTDDGTKLKYIKKLDKIEKRLQKKYQDISDTIKLINAKHFSKMLSLDSNDQLTHEEANEKTRIYYEAYLRGAELLREYLDESLTRTKVRLEEEAENPDFNLIFSQWSHDNQPGRSKYWMHSHSGLIGTLPGDTVETLDKISTLFDVILREDDKSLFDHFHNPPDNPLLVLDERPHAKKFVENVLTNFEQGDIAALERAASGLSQRTETSNKQIYALTQGLLHELEGDYSSATQAYQTINPSHGWDVRQLGLERILAYSVEQENYAAALETLKELASKVPSYMPLYAQLLEASGDIEKAAETYTAYLTDHPDDLETMHELGMLFYRAGATEAAVSALDHIKAINPSHPAIASLQATIDG